MVTHISYDQVQYPNAGACLSGIRQYLDLGWQISRLCGPGNGPFLVIYRKDG